jgi:tetratricopeptide (TPR) repeat protein
MRDKLRQIKEWMKNHKKTVVVLVLLKLFLKIALLGWIIFASNKCSAQSTNKLLREGNKSYDKEKYNNATESYSKALQKAPKDVRANFNQGDAFFKLNELDKAKEQYMSAARLSKNTDIQAKAFYNIGNAWYKQEKYEESAKAYKVSLKLNPKDTQAKYNLMMALAKIKKNGGGGKNDQKDKDKKDQQKDKKDQQKNQDKQQQGQNPQQQQQQQQQQKPISDEEAKRLLDAIQGEEIKVQQKVSKEKGKPSNVKVQKDW